jgi:hypothetical protein
VSALDVSPANASIATSEVLPWGFDFAALLNPGESVSAAASTMVDVTNPANPTPVTLTDLPQLPQVGAVPPYTTVVTQTVRGSNLVAGHLYRLSVSVIILARTVTMDLNVNVPH